MVSQAHQMVSNGDAPTSGGAIQSKALEVARGGISTPYDLTNFAIAHSIDILQGAMGAKDANASLRGVQVGLRAVEVGQRVGAHHEVSRISADSGRGKESEADALSRREAELTAELEAIRERRSA